MGSGTTAIVCVQLKRNYIGSEISKEYCDIANKRLEEKINCQWCGTVSDSFDINISCNG